VSRWNVTATNAGAPPPTGWWRPNAARSRSSAPPDLPHQAVRWSIRRTVVTANITWRLPFDNICTFSDYSGAPIHAGGTWLKTVVIKTNCSKPPHGWGDVGAPSSIHLFESPDLRSWRWRNVVAAGNETDGAAEGANENAIAVLDDGSLIVVFRRDGGDGWPLHSHKSFMMVRSTTAGRSWSTPHALPAHVLSARPQLLKLPGGPLILTGGRPHLMLWVSLDGAGRTWTASFNLAWEHNRRQLDASLRFCPAFA
jgi:hypothetical protein